MSERDQQQPRSPLESGRGSTIIRDGAVSKIAGMAAGEVEGIRMGGTASRAAGGILGSVTGSQGLSRGVSVEAGKTEAAIDLIMGIEYGRNIPQLAERVRSKVTERVESLTGLRVTELNVTIGDIVFPDQEEGGVEERRRGRLQSGTREETRPLARRTEEIRASSREREDSDETQPIEEVRASEQSRTAGQREREDREEVRVEGAPLREDETAELRLEDDDDTRRMRRRDR